ncbi:MAG: DinB family protein [Ferruginibacter sp.]
MKETKRISGLFTDIYNGDSWIGETLSGVLANVSAADAAKKTAPWNSIWEIVNHIISWRDNVLLRVQGNIMKTPAGNYFTPVTDQSDTAWKNTLHELKLSQEKWINFLQIMLEEDLENIYPNNNNTYYHNIHGIIQHDAYHLGQIVLLAKLN